MLKQTICGLGILTALTACGPTPTKKTPRAADNIPTYEPIKANASAGASTSTPSSGSSSSGTTLTGSNNFVSAAGGAAFDIKTLKNSTWQSTCYKFGAATDYSKKFWTFGEDTITSLILKFSDATCKQSVKNADGTAKTATTWVVGSLSSAPSIETWAVVSGTCVKGCNIPFKSSFRSTATILNEGSLVTGTENFNTDEGKYVSFTKAKSVIDLDALGANPASGNTGPATNAPVVPAAPLEPSTGLGLIASLAGQSWNVCYASKNTEAGVAVDRGSLRTLTFVKGADAASDGYVSALTIMSNTDCTGDVISVKANQTRTNLLVSAGPSEGWLLVATRTCTANCSAAKSLMKLPTETTGLVEAGENTKLPGTFYTETPRVYTLVP